MREQRQRRSLVSFTQMLPVSGVPTSVRPVVLRGDKPQVRVGSAEVDIHI
jgi:hypothetical protein